MKTYNQLKAENKRLRKQNKALTKAIKGLIKILDLIVDYIGGKK